MSDRTVSPEDRQSADEHAASRATPLPEEAAGAPTTGDPRDSAAEILRESEERMAGAVSGDEPGDDADQNRRSEETL
ncbi:hypothetical protein EV383_0571 [Pseudonocardia sediminis]|uniref:Uncharacterized protein n=1 Tax=Pseudonocardia sediminis TaxID=1397368 RepID=A0A4Q7UUN9_PSEST|nr:hypothetical protein [Pseudonocardia sediminis]RZT83753.1 hypothetical protein EV383_0571 [Pseudonocardia sediminis]